MYPGLPLMYDSAQSRALPLRYAHAYKIFSKSVGNLVAFPLNFMFSWVFHALSFVWVPSYLSGAAIFSALLWVILSLRAAFIASRAATWSSSSLTLSGVAVAAAVAASSIVGAMSSLCSDSCMLDSRAGVRDLDRLLDALVTLKTDSDSRF